MRSTIEKNVNCLEKTNSRNMDVYNSTSENSEGSKKHVRKAYIILEYT